MLICNSTTTGQTPSAEESRERLLIGPWGESVCPTKYFLHYMVPAYIKRSQFCLRQLDQLWLPSRYSVPETPQVTMPQLKENKSQGDRWQYFKFNKCTLTLSLCVKCTEPVMPTLSWGEAQGISSISSRRQCAFRAKQQQQQQQQQRKRVSVKALSSS